MTRILLLGGGVAAPLAAVILAVIAGFSEPDYSQIEDHLSGLASVPSTTRWVMTPAFLAAGIGAILFAVGLGRFIGPTRAMTVALLAGVFTVLVGIFPRSCVTVACADPAWHHRLHDVFSVPAYGTLIAVPVMVSAHTELGVSRRWAGFTAVTAAGLGVVFVTDLVSGWGGLVQRALVVVPLIWLAGTATRLTRRDQPRR